MTPAQKLKHLILLKAAELAGDEQAIATDYIDNLYAKLRDEDGDWEAGNEIRGGEIETGIKCEWSRHYESKSVATQYIDGSWIGWTYWYGGGKHGEPESIDWIADAYDVAVTEEEKLVTVRTFEKATADG